MYDVVFVCMRFISVLSFSMELHPYKQSGAILFGGSPILLFLANRELVHPRRGLSPRVLLLVPISFQVAIPIALRLRRAEGLLRQLATLPHGLLLDGVGVVALTSAWVPRRAARHAADAHFGRKHCEERTRQRSATREAAA
jgi:hypothetical protein